jgi:membrane protease YdiL (CAAX protease family)
MRSHPLTGYLLVAFVPAWSWFLLALAVWRLPWHGPAASVATFLGPGLAAVVMTAVVGGRTGLRDLLRRCVRWRVAPVWYLVALAGWPALTVAAMLALPGAAAALTAPTAGFATSFLGIFLVVLVFGGPLGEEPGWRGFALPTLQRRIGPLPAALAVGALHGFWHLPVYLLVPGYNGAPPDLPGIGGAFLGFVVSVMAGSVLAAWIFNNARGSLLLAILHHASTNSVGVVLAATLPGWDAMTPSVVVRPLLHVGVAALVVVATRGGLSYARYCRETGDRPARCHRSATRGAR